MKAACLTGVVVVADQMGSRSADDAVPGALDALRPVTALLGFERTAGDEIQALFAEAPPVLRAVSVLTRLGRWRVGVGVGAVDTPLPTTTRAARGPAYLAARRAVTAARRSPTGLALRCAEAGPGVGPVPYGEGDTMADDLEGVMWMLRSLLQRRSAEGWELLDLLGAGLTQQAAAERLGISGSAVSQRLHRSARTEIDRGTRAAEHLLEALLRGLRPVEETR